jgi:hypothetical protein
MNAQGQAVASSSTSIFISHVNGDPDAEEVLRALVDGLKQALTPSHDAYEIVYDREIVVGKEWLTAIYNWLLDCPASIILVSKAAFDPGKPWVSNEAFFLTVDQTRRRDLCIIPVLLQGVEPLLASSPIFKPSRLAAIQALRYLHASGGITLEALVSAIADRLKQELPPYGAKPLVGLAAALADKLSACQSASKIGPRSAFKIDPLFRRSAQR